MSHMSRIEIDDDLIVRYLTGDAEPDEAVAMSEWLTSSANSAYFSQFENTWRRSAGAVQPEFNKRDAWKRVSVEIHVPVAAARTTRTTSFWPIGVAAAVITLAVSAYFLFFVTPKHDVVEMGKVATSDGFRFVELSDRSTVTLHRNSELQYPDQFQEADRRVRLARGEAFFNVASDAGKPFVVEANGVEIKVLGTEFNVQLSDTEITIHVREGRVFVRSAADSITLTAGLSGHVVAGDITVTDSSVGNLYSYATQRLVFNDASLTQVIHDLEDSYPYTFELKNQSLKNCRLTANFYKDDIDKIVNLVAETLNLTVTKDGRHFTLEGEGCL
jgi:transmembrane sensor